MGKFDFYLITDIHYFERSLGCSGEAYENYMKSQQKEMGRNQPTNRVLFDKLAEDKAVETILIAGDLTQNGEYESHKSLIEDLRKLKASGKRILLITALHDHSDHPFAFEGNERLKIKGTTNEELYEMYREFGYDEAIAFDENSYSYVAKLTDGVRLLAINVDGIPHECEGCIDERLKQWLSDQIDEANAAGDKIIAMEHYPLIPQQPIFDLIGDAHLKDWQNRAAFLADKGVHLILTGHMHAQSIKKFTSSSGNSIIDIQTSSTIGYPVNYRKMTIEGDKIAVKVLDVPAYTAEDGTLVDKDYFRALFSEMIPNKLGSMLKDGKPDQTFVQKTALKLARKLTVGGLMRMVGLSASKELRDMKITDFAVMLVLPMFEGDPKFTPGTPVYNDLSKLLKRISPVLGKLNKKLSKNGKTVDLKELIMSSLYNADGQSDNECVIEF